MIHDLDAGDLPVNECDFVIIGAGTVGLPVAVALAKRLGARVVCVESGGWRQAEETHPLNRVTQTASNYKGADHGRFRCLGGTSTRWGGALIPLMESDLRDADWPVTFDELNAYLPEVEGFFGLNHDSYVSEQFPVPIGKEFIVRCAKWPPFKQRNVYNILRKECHELKPLTISLNSTVTSIRILQGDKIAIGFQSPAGRRAGVSCKRLIIAAGAIESTRLALLLDHQNDRVISRSTPALGRYFADHLSVPIAEIIPTRRSRFNEVFGYGFFKSGAMTNIRFEATNGAALRRVLPPFFCHVAFETTAPGAFDALKEIYRKLQSNSLPSPSVLVRLLRSLPWLLRAAWWRFVKKRLLYPSDARIRIHAVIEQTPTPDNRITLSAEERDPYGVPVPVVEWNISEQDVAALRELANTFSEMWSSTGLQQLGNLQRREMTDIESDLSNVGGIYHPTGTTRMAADPSAGVVDKNLSLFHCKSIQILSTSVLPTGGGSNPTMMVLLLAMRCIDQHVRASQ